MYTLLFEFEFQHFTSECVKARQIILRFSIMLLLLTMQISQFIENYKTAFLTNLADTKRERRIKTYKLNECIKLVQEYHPQVQWLLGTGKCSLNVFIF